MRLRIATAAVVATLITAMGAPAFAATKSYTMAQVRTHAKAGNCWTAINGGVYNLTKWVNRHPGGPAVITALCGRDGSAAFTAQHRGQGEPNAMLASYRVGALKK